MKSAYFGSVLIGIPQMRLLLLSWNDAASRSGSEGGVRPAGGGRELIPSARGVDLRGSSGAVSVGRYLGERRHHSVHSAPGGRPEGSVRTAQG